MIDNIFSWNVVLSKIEYPVPAHDLAMTQHVTENNIVRLDSSPQVIKPGQHRRRAKRILRYRQLASLVVLNDDFKSRRNGRYDVAKVVVESNYRVPQVVSTIS